MRINLYSAGGGKYHRQERRHSEAISGRGKKDNISLKTTVLGWFCCYPCWHQHRRAVQRSTSATGAAQRGLWRWLKILYQLYINSIILSLTIFYQLYINSSILFCLYYNISGDRQHRIHLQGLHPHLQQVRRGQFFATKDNIESIFTHNFCHRFFTYMPVAWLAKI